MKCACCDNELSFQWCDHHGIGACTTCGLPHVIYHYDDDQKRVDKPPEPAITPEGIALARRYWGETRGRVFPGAYDMGFLGGRGETYSGATRSDMTNWKEWCTANEAQPF